MTHRNASSAVVALVLGLTLAACGGGSSDGGEKAAAPTASTKNVKYDSVDDLRQAFVDAGGSCDPWDQSDVVSAALESGNCGDDTVLSIYVDRDEAKAAAENLTAIGSDLGGEDSSVLVGPNWVVNTGQTSDELISLKKVLGGTIVTSYAS